MSAAYLAGLRTAMRQWRLCMVLFTASFAAALCFTAATWVWLANALDSGLPTRTLLRELDMDVFVDLLVHHGDSLRMLLATAALAAVFFGALSVWLNGAVVAAIADDVGLSDALRRGLGSSPTYFRLWLLAAVSNGTSVLAVFWTARALTRWTAETTSEMTYYWIVGSAGVAAALLVLFFTTAHDYARIRSSITGAGAARAYAWALGFVVRREWRALPLAAALCASGFGMWVIYQTVAMLIPTSSAGAVAGSLVWGQVLMAARAVLRVWWFAAETELQSMNES
jgi:hypothetical protein